jgi:ABC-type multidrug transport system fused ATPase/permease subunit
MEEQASYLNHAVRMKHGLIILLTKVLKKYRRTFYIFQFYIKGFKRTLLALVVFSILLGLMETFQIVLLYPILNASFNLQDQGITFFEPLYNLVRKTFNLPDVVAFSLLFIVLVFLTFLGTLIYKYLSLNFTKKVIIQTKRSIFDKLAASDYRYFVDNRRGDILYAVIAAPGRIKEFLEVSTGIFSDFVVIMAILVMLFFVSTYGVALMLVGGVFFVLVIRFIGKRFAYRLGKRQLRSIQSENEVINGYIQGIRQIRSVYGDSYWKEKYNQALSNYWDKFIKYSFLKNLPIATLNFLFFSLIAVVVIVLFYLYQENFIYVIPLIGTFAFSALKVLPRLSSIGNNYMTAMDSWPNLEKVYRFLNDPRYSLLRNGTKVFEAFTSDIVFENVNFSYYKHQELIEGVNLSIRKNKITALVGPSGSGKSTIVSLLLRYYDVSNGNIIINGTDLREYDLKSYLQKIGYVSQDTFIYNATVRENIAFGGDYSDERIIEAAKKANIHTFIASLPEGYCTIVGDQGLKLSGGEKQRIAIARALVRDPELLVLDEATSNLDNQSEAIVQASINQVSMNITTFIVAHRLSTIRKADTIFVMIGGRIVESGSHDALMEKRGRYFEIYEAGGDTE